MRTIASFLIIALASISMGATTYAYFSDQEEVNGMSFVSGTMDLTLGGTTAFRTGLGSTVFAPGDSLGGTLTLTNAGNVPGVLDWKAVVAQTDRYGGTTDLASYIVITELVYAGDDHLSGTDGGAALADTDGNGRIDLGDLAATGVFAGAPPPGSDGTAFTMKVKFHPSGGNALQGDTVTLDLVFQLRQAAGTPLA